MPHEIEQATLDALRRGGTPDSILSKLEGYVREADRIRAQQFLPVKEKAELAQIKERTAHSLLAEIDEMTAAAKIERDRELAAVATAIEYAQRLPEKQDLETDSEFQAKLTERHIREVRDLAALTAASSDVALALVCNDVPLLEELVSESLEGGHPEHVRRVARAVELKLRTMAVDEVTRGDAVERIAGPAVQRVAERLRAWRAEQTEKSPAVRKQRIEARFQMRVDDAHSIVERAARGFDMSVGPAHHTRPL